MSNEIDHEFTKEIVCPWCGHEETESYEHSSDDGKLTCESCEKDFYYERDTTVDYTTEKAKYGTCTMCNAENVVLESRTAFPYPECKDLCESCISKEEKRQRDEYFEKRSKEDQERLRKEAEK